MAGNRMVPPTPQLRIAEGEGRSKSARSVTGPDCRFLYVLRYARFPSTGLPNEEKHMRTHSHRLGPRTVDKRLLALIALLALVSAGGHRAASQSPYLAIDLGRRFEARAVNASGQVTGRVFNQAFLWDQGATTPFGPLGTMAFSINAAGHVAGMS